MVDISVIIPTYNRKESIERSINSVLSQDFSGSYEIIISDDGSIDGTIEVVKKKYKDKVILLQKPYLCKDQGASGARNRGLNIAQGRYVCFLDSDDTYEPTFFSRCYDELSANENLGYVFCRVNKLINESNNGVIIRPWTRSHLSYLDKNYHVLHRAFCLCTISIMCRRNIINEVGRFDTTLVVGEDSDMWIRLSEISQGAFVDFVGATYYINGCGNNQLTELTTKKLKKECSIKVYKNALKRCNDHKCQDKMRLLIINLTLMLLESSEENGKLQILYTMCKLFFVSPITLIRYIILRFS